jgi:hypothetical protein
LALMPPTAAPRSSGRLAPYGPEGPRRTGQRFGCFVAPPRRVESASDAWPVRALTPKGFGPMRPARRRSPKGPPLPPVRWPPGGGCAAGSSVCRARGLWRREGRARWGAPGGAVPEGVAASPRRRAVAFVPALPTPGCLRPGGRWRLGVPIASGPGGSVASVLGSRRSPSPWVGARGSVASVLGSRRSLSPWVWSRGSVASVWGARRRPFPWVWSRWVRRLGLGRPKASFPVGLVPWIPLLRVWPRWVRRLGSGLPKEPFPVGLVPVGPSP